MIFKKTILAVILSVLSFVTAAEITIQNGKTEVTTLADLLVALETAEVSTVIIKNTIVLENGTFLAANGTADGTRKVVQVEKPFLPESGRVTLLSSKSNGVLDTIDTPREDEYSNYNLFTIQSGANVVISNLTLMGGFTGKRNVNADEASTGGIDNYGKLSMYKCDITRTGTAVLNRPRAVSVLVDCNIVRNANWYGGGILNFATPSDSQYIDGGTVIMDRCSLSENESLGPAHGGGAAENQGLMCLNNCVIANNASTEIGGGINNCKGGDLYVMNCTFTGNITTSHEYGTTAGGAIGNAGGAGNVYIVNSILANNGYDTGEFVNSVSLGRYEGSSSEHYCHLANTAIDATAGMDRLDSTNITVKVDGLFAGYSESGIVASGGANIKDDIHYSSAFLHPNIAPGERAEKWRFAPSMKSLEPDHYIYTLSVDTFFDYSGVLDGTMPAMGYLSADGIVKLGPDVAVPNSEMKVDVTFNGDARGEYNALGAVTVSPLLNPEKPIQPGIFEVRLGEFSGGKVSGVTVYGDSYVSNSVVTVHAVAESAHYLDGWKINDEVVPKTQQQYIFSFSVVTNITITPIFQPVVTQIYNAQQRYPWNNLVDIDYSVAEKNAVRYRLIFLATYEEDGQTHTIQLKTFRKNANVFEMQRLGEREDLHRAGDHRVTWDSAADGVDIKGKTVHYRIMACEGDER